MRNTLHRVTGAFAALAMLLVTACASGGGMASDTPMTDQALIRVLNNSDEPSVTVSIESIEGNTVALGIVQKGDTEALVFELPEGVHTYRLVAVGPEDEDRTEYHVSPEFTVDGGATVNWYLLENEIEVT